MISEMYPHKYIWVDGINIACHVLNRAMIRPILDRKPYELFNGKDILGDIKTDSR